MKKKGQLTLNDAPMVITLVGITFLIMATIAYVGSKYQTAFPSDLSVSVANETLTTVNYAGEYVAGSRQCNFEEFSLVRVYNTTSGNLINAANYTYTSTGLVRSITNGIYNNTNWNVTYTYKMAPGTACNVTGDLQSEISNNTSIAGIVLTISLVGIVLTVLIGIFVIARNRGM